MKKSTMRVRAEFITPFLATASGNPELQEEFIAAKVHDYKGEITPDEKAAKMVEEIAAVPVEEQISKGSTVFQRDKTGLHVWDYTWRGFFKECVSQMIELGEVKKLNPWNYKKACDGALYVNPRRVYLFDKNGKLIDKPHGTLQRPLRATTLRGDRVALARSEFVEEGSYCEFEVVLFESQSNKDYAAWRELTPELIKQCLDMGNYKGSGQWRSGGYGRFTWSEMPTVAKA